MRSNNISDCTGVIELKKSFCCYWNENGKQIKKSGFPNMYSAWKYRLEKLRELNEQGKANYQDFHGVN